MLPPIESLDLFRADLPAARKHYCDLLQSLAALIQEAIGSNFQALYLIGSPGRGEATLIKVQGAWQIANDIDLMLIVRHSINRAELFNLMDRCTRLVNPSSTYVRTEPSAIDLHVDINQLVESTIGSTPSTLLFLDFIHGATLIAGREHRRPLEFPLDQIPIVEAYLLLYNRMCSLIETIDSNSFQASAGPKSARWIAAYYFSKKAILDAGSAILIGRQRYTPDYDERTRRLWEMRPNFAERYAWWVATTTIDPDALNGQLLREAWLEAYDAIEMSRNALLLPPISCGLSKWRRAHLQFLFHEVERSSKANVAKAVRRLVRRTLSWPALRRRLSAYGEAERLADEWRSFMDGQATLATDEWMRRRDRTVGVWKSLNWA